MFKILFIRQIPFTQVLSVDVKKNREIVASLARVGFIWICCKVITLEGKMTAEFCVLSPNQIDDTVR